MNDDRKCDKCGAAIDKYDWSDHCAAYICSKCGKHQGMVRCWCGWSESGRNGRAELEELGETIDPEPSVGGFDEGW